MAAKTLYQGILEGVSVDNRTKRPLKKLYLCLNPFSLKREIVYLQNRLDNMPLEKPRLPLRVDLLSSDFYMVKK